MSIDPTLTVTRPMLRVVTKAELGGWRAEWMHRLLVLRKFVGGTEYLVQVLFKDGRWDYALTFNRHGGHWVQRPFAEYTGIESEAQIVTRRADLFAHLSNPA